MSQVATALQITPLPETCSPSTAAMRRIRPRFRRSVRQAMYFYMTVGSGTLWLRTKLTNRAWALIVRYAPWWLNLTPTNDRHTRPPTHGGRNQRQELRIDTNATAGICQPNQQRSAVLSALGDLMHANQSGNGLPKFQVQQLTLNRFSLRSVGHQNFSMYSITNWVPASWLT